MDYRFTIPAVVGPGPVYPWLLSQWRVVTKRQVGGVGSPLGRFIVERERRLSA